MSGPPLTLAYLNRQLLWRSAECAECLAVIYGKDMYAHIVLCHKRMPKKIEVPCIFYPSRGAMKKLKPYIRKILRRFFRRQEAGVPRNVVGRFRAVHQQFETDVRIGFFLRST